MDLGSC